MLMKYNEINYMGLMAAKLRNYLLVMKPKGLFTVYEANGHS